LVAHDPIDLPASLSEPKGSDRFEYAMVYVTSKVDGADWKHDVSLQDPTGRFYFVGLFGPYEGDTEDRFLTQLLTQLGLAGWEIVTDNPRPAAYQDYGAPDDQGRRFLYTLASFVGHEYLLKRRLA
jgi:hypothetical protein